MATVLTFLLATAFARQHRPIISWTVSEVAEFLSEGGGHRTACALAIANGIDGKTLRRLLPADVGSWGWTMPADLAVADRALAIALNQAVHMSSGESEAAGSGSNPAVPVEQHNSLQQLAISLVSEMMELMSRARCVSDMVIGVIGPLELVTTLQEHFISLFVVGLPTLPTDNQMIALDDPWTALHDTAAALKNMSVVVIADARGHLVYQPLFVPGTLGLPVCCTRL